MAKKLTIAALIALFALPAFAEDAGGYKSGEQPPAKQDSGYKGTEDTTYDATDQVRMNGRVRQDGERRWVDVEQVEKP